MSVHCCLLKQRCLRRYQLAEMFVRAERFPPRLCSGAAQGRGFSKDGEIRVIASRCYCQDRGKNYYSELTCFSGRFVGGSSVACYTIRTFLWDTEASQGMGRNGSTPAGFTGRIKARFFIASGSINHLDSSSYQTWLPIGSEIVFSN